jgi:hypothetical protein
MTNHPFRPDPAPGTRSQRGAALPWVFFGFLAVAGFFFFTEHRAHLMGALPFLLLALCPLMHFFHGGHGGHGSSGGHQGHGGPAPGPSDAGDRSASQEGRPSTPPAPRPPHQH